MNLSILSTFLVNFDSANGDCPYRSSGFLSFLSTTSLGLIIHFAERFSATEQEASCSSHTSSSVPTTKPHQGGKRQKEHISTIPTKIGLLWSISPPPPSKPQPQPLLPHQCNPPPQFATIRGHLHIPFSSPQIRSPEPSPNPPNQEPLPPPPPNWRHRNDSEPSCCLLLYGKGSSLYYRFPKAQPHGLAVTWNGLHFLLVKTGFPPADVGAAWVRQRLVNSRKNLTSTMMVD